jgi:hypothetical protein
LWIFTFGWTSGGDLTLEYKVFALLYFLQALGLVPSIALEAGEDADSTNQKANKNSKDHYSKEGVNHLIGSNLNCVVDIISSQCVLGGVLLLEPVGCDVTFKRVWRQFCLIDSFNFLNKVLHLREAILVVLQHSVKLFNIRVHVAVFVLKECLILLFDLLEDVHLVEQPFNLIVSLVLLHLHQVVEVLDQTAFEALLDLLSFTDRVVDFI